jgi:hypothetical protein
MLEAVFAKYSALIMAMVAAILGRLMYHSAQVQKGKRRFWSLALLLDLVIAQGMGVIAFGACSYWGLSEFAMAAVCSASGYLGPHAIDEIYEIIKEKFDDDDNQKDRS